MEELIVQTVLTAFILLMYIGTSNVIKFFNLRELSPIERVILKDFERMMKIIVINDWGEKSLAWKLGKMKDIIDYIEARK
jgi:hypothetical protein